MVDDENEMMRMSTQSDHPIIIVAPTQRCGTTLLQRAINSTESAIVYGENFALTEIYPQMISRWQSNSDMRIKKTREARRRLLAGRFNDEMSALVPNFERLGDLHRANFDNIVDFYSNDALRMGFSRWGLKTQPNDVFAFIQFCRLVPSAHYLFIYRNIFDVARSVKARWKATTVDEFSALGARWARNYGVFRGLGGRKVLHIEYNHLVQDPDRWIPKIEAACEIDGISRAVFDTKVNVSDLIDDLTVEELKTGYRAPENLSQAEYDAVALAAGPLAEQLGYSRELQPS